MITKLKNLLQGLSTPEKSSSQLTRTTTSDKLTSNLTPEPQNESLTPQGSISEEIQIQVLPTSQFSPGFHNFNHLSQKNPLNPNFIESFSDLMKNQEYEKALNVIKLHSERINASLILAAETNDHDLCKRLLDKRELGELAAKCASRDSLGNTALHIASAKGFLKVCETLLDYGEKIEINGKNLDGRSPLHLACLNGFKDIALLLVRSGALVNSPDEQGNTPVHLAAVSGNLALVEWFITKSPDLHLKNSSGKTPSDLTSNPSIKQILEKSSSPSPIFSLSKSFDFLGMMHKINHLIRKSSNNEEFDTSVKLTPNHFKPVQMLGKGSFGEVYLVEKKDSNKLYAMKILLKTKIMGQNLIRYAVTERNVMSCIRHPFIVALRYSFQTANKLYLILDYCPGGSLSLHLKREIRFSEERARVYLCEVILAIEELHKRDIIYRDLKPDNVVLDQEGHAMLTDFGLSKEGVQEKDSAKSFCGSVAYLAPEMLQRTGHGKAVDWYLLGTLLYEMIIGIPPFYSKDRNELFYNIKKGKLRVPAGLSQECKNLMRDLLQKDPSKRLGSVNDSEDIKSHEFFKGIDWKIVFEKGLQTVVPHVSVVGEGYLEDNVIGDSLDEKQQVLPGWTFVSN